MKRIAAIILLSLAATVVEARSYRYDGAGRLVLAIYDNGLALRYTYTHGNNIAKVERMSVPASPGQFSVTRDSPARAVLSWENRGSSETGYTVERRSVFSSRWETVAQLDPDADAYTDENLDPSRNYVYRVFATGPVDGLMSAYSPEILASGVESLALAITSIDLYDLDASLFSLSFESESGKQYELQSSTSLEPDSWQTYPWKQTPDGAEATGSIAGNADSTSIYMTASNAQGTYFRVVLAQ